MMFLVQTNANRVQTILILGAKEETAFASIVQLVGRPKTAAQNVSRAVQARSALGVQNVHWVLPDKGTTTMRLNANNVN
jgi:hypothetical protein